MKQVGTFDTRNPDRLAENLDRLQANVVSELQLIRLTTMLEPEPKAFNGGDPFASFSTDQIAVVNTITGDVRIGLSKPSNPGFAAIAKQFAANSVIVTPAGNNAGAPVLINGAASKVYATVGLYWLFFDGLNWLG